MISCYIGDCVPAKHCTTVRQQYSYTLHNMHALNNKHIIHIELAITSYIIHSTPYTQHLRRKNFTVFVVLNPTMNVLRCSHKYSLLREAATMNVSCERSFSLLTAKTF